MESEVGTAYPQPSCAIEEITPETADKWLALNHANRRLSDPVVSRLVGIIQRGEWMPDCTDGIGLDLDGGVINGQHRLTAISHSGQSVRALVIRNVRPEVIKVIDQGRGRTFVQLLQMRGDVAAPTVVAPALDWLYRMNAGFEQSMPTAFKPTIPQLLDLLAEHRNIVQSVPAAQEAFRTAQLPPKGQLCAYHYAMASVDSELADDFFNALATGVDLGERAPVRVLRERLIRENARDKSRQVRSFVVDAWLVKAWEFTRQGMEITDRQLEWKTTGRGREPFPRVTDLPWDTTDSAIEDDDDSDDCVEDSEE
jgi:hypothetical protein